MRVHQNIILNGMDMGDDPTRKNSRFCNEGKWNNFIKPLLPRNPQDLTFFEYGSNAGLFLRMAMEYGFRDVWGIEHSNRHVRMAEKYRKSLNMNYRMIHDYISEDYNFDPLPISDISLLANFHYHLEIPVLRKLMDNLEVKTCHALVVSVENIREHPWRASGKRESLLAYFKNWEKLGECTGVPMEGDPHPRQMYSMLFKSPKLKRLNFNEIKLRNPHHEHTSTMIEEFINFSLRDENLDIRKTKYYTREVRRRSHKWPEERIFKMIEAKHKLIRDVLANGVKNPLILDSNNFIIDGYHRYFILKVLGYTSAIVRNI